MKWLLVSVITGMVGFLFLGTEAGARVLDRMGVDANHPVVIVIDQAPTARSASSPQTQVPATSTSTRTQPRSDWGDTSAATAQADDDTVDVADMRQAPLRTDSRLKTAPDAPAAPLTTQRTSAGKPCPTNSLSRGLTGQSYSSMFA